ncbi:ribonuclease Z [Flavobacterium psychrotolerans]|uniref:Ribonuclease Z n=1 Tax=Flavobacterium psychrotolerans TaxID=2169410 RepID=A0A2U1JGV1_9FLAO|nr:ribonuclease Z [Flavobacterium psychrotolerans]PWA04380.1 ribonuclease Z [Flavobacterium psychrotolerans]
MKVDQKGHTVSIKDTQGDLVSFLMKVTHEYKTFEKHNMIVDVSLHKNPSLKEINGFLPLSKTHKKNKKSFVIVAQGVDFNTISDKLTVVPTPLEARDIIDMEEIERDLGF